jgi:hypothetical protein
MSKKKKLTRIPLNLWDDYDDEEDCDTHMYIEEYDKLTDDQKIPIIEFVFARLKTLDLTGVEIGHDGHDISFTNLTHERREKLVGELEALKLMWGEIPLDFYSES